MSVNPGNISHVLRLSLSLFPLRTSLKTAFFDGPEISKWGDNDSQWSVRGIFIICCLYDNHQLLQPTIHLCSSLTPSLLPYSSHTTPRILSASSKSSFQLERVLHTCIASSNGRWVLNVIKEWHIKVTSSKRTNRKKIAKIRKMFISMLCKIARRATSGLIPVFLSSFQAQLLFNRSESF